MDLVLDFLRNQLNLSKDDKIVIGVSAGPDSMCLLKILLNLRSKIGFQIIVAHVNHQKRLASKEEEEFIKKYCQANDCLLEVMRIEQYSHANFHQEAREKRYHFYQELLEKYQASYLMTAHHGDDLIETILMRLVRGSSLSGYKGISLISNMKTYLIARPLLYVTKDDIIKFNQANNVPYRIDQSNFSSKYTRNRYRMKMLPFLKSENPNVHLKFLAFSQKLEENNNYIEKVVLNTYNNIRREDGFLIALFKQEDILIRKRVLEYILSQIYDDLTSLSSKHIDLLLNLINKNKSGSKISLPGGVIARIDYGLFNFSKDHSRKTNYNLELKDGLILPNGLKFIQYNGLDNGNDTLHLSSKDIKLPLYVRNKKKGDVIELKGMNGRKKVSDIFIDKKLNRLERDTYPVVVDANNQIVWIPKLKKSKYDSQNGELCDIIFKCL